MSEEKEDSQLSLGIELCYQLSSIIASSEMRAWSGYSDLSKECENYIIPVLCWLYCLPNSKDSSKGLRNANIIKKNQRGFDLVCDDPEVYFQVTSQKGIKKVRDTVKQINSYEKKKGLRQRPIYMVILHPEPGLSNLVDVDDPLSDNVHNGWKETIKSIIVSSDGDPSSKTDEADAKEDKGRVVYVLSANLVYDKILLRLTDSKVEGGKIVKLGTPTSWFKDIWTDKGTLDLINQYKSITGIKSYTDVMRFVMGGDDGLLALNEARDQAGLSIRTIVKEFVNEVEGSEDNLDVYVGALSEMSALAVHCDEDHEFANALTKCSLRYENAALITAPSDSFKRKPLYSPLNTNHFDGSEDYYIEFPINGSSRYGYHDAYSLLVGIIEYKHPEYNNHSEFNKQRILEHISNFLKIGDPEKL